MSGQFRKLDFDLNHFFKENISLKLLLLFLMFCVLNLLFRVDRCRRLDESCFLFRVFLFPNITRKCFPNLFAPNKCSPNLFLNSDVVVMVNICDKCRQRDNRVTMNDRILIYSNIICLQIHWFKSNTIVHSINTHFIRVKNSDRFVGCHLCVDERHRHMIGSGEPCIPNTERKFILKRKVG